MSVYAIVNKNFELAKHTKRSTRQLQVWLLALFTLRYARVVPLERGLFAQCIIPNHLEFKRKYTGSGTTKSVSCGKIDLNITFLFDKQCLTLYDYTHEHACTHTHRERNNSIIDRHFRRNSTQLYTNIRKT